ncbi:MAG: hypothetical protein LBJ58_02795 [Tannerellaceae bacterium]|jgi:hypothetical protein|nr:hypothetical protein [Tannerellaceae bacterium]
MNNLKVKFLSTCLLAASLTGLRAQDTEFWFVAPHMSEQLAAGIPLNRPAFLAISNGNYQAANVTVTRYNGANASLVNTTTIPAGGLYKLDFTSDLDMKTIENPRGLAGSVTEFGIHITSSVPVTAYYMHNHTDSRDIFTLKGHQALGTLFYVPMQSDNAQMTGGYVGACDQIDIVATADGITNVTVTPKAAIRLGTSTSSAANTPISRNLNKGETLKIMEYTPNSGSLTGTKIVATQPVAVTVTEDLVGGDTSGDQIVPVTSLGTRYIVPRGPQTNASSERFYIVGAYDGTKVDLYTSGSTPTVSQLPLSAGQAYRYTFNSSVNAVYVDATQPVYIYQRSGFGEEGAAILPSVYAIGQTEMSFYQVQGEHELGFLLFRSGKGGDFKVSYGSVVNATLNTGSAIAIPNVSEWQMARFSLLSAANNQVVTIRNSESPFSFGYIAANTSRNNMGLYGYFSAFGTFEFSDTTWMCGNSVTIEGGYARDYLWTYPDGVTTATTSSITVTQEGVYTLVMAQDPNVVTATTYVKKVNAGTVSPASQAFCSSGTSVPLTVSGAIEPPGTTYLWQTSADNSTWTNINGATSATYSPGTLTASGTETRTVYYRRGMTSDYCAMAYTYAASIIVGAIPAAPSISVTDVCAGSDGSATVTAVPPTGSTTDWYAAANGGSPILTGNNTLTRTAVAQVATFYAESRNTTSGCVSTTRTAVTVYPTLNPGSVTGSPTTICYNSITLLANGSTPTGGDGTYSYQWQKSTDSITWTNVNTSVAFSTWLTESAYFRRGVTSGPCGPVYAAPVFITVNPLPTVNAVTDTIVCAGTTVPQRAFATSTPGTTFTWTNDNVTIGLAASGTGNLPQFTAQSDSPHTITAAITVTPHINGCDGAPITYNIKVSSCAAPINPNLRTTATD